MIVRKLINLALAASASAASVKLSRTPECSKHIEGVTRKDCQHMASIGMAGMGDNVLEDNGYIWIGDDGPNTFEFINKASQGPITLILWDFPDANYEASFMNVRRPKISYSLPSPDSSVTISVGNGISGAWSTLHGHTTTLSEYGQVKNTWGEFTTGLFATVDVSRLINMNGNSQSIHVSSGCTADMNSCSFHCKNGLDQCGESGTYELVGCDPNTNPNASIGTYYGGNPEGGCMGWDDGGHLQIILGD